MKKGGSKAFTYIFLVFFALIFLYPFLWMLSGSLKPDFDVMNLGLYSSHFTSSNYSLVFDRIPILRSFVNSLIVATAVTFCVVVFGAIVGYALAKVNWKGARYLIVFLIFTMTIPFQLTLIPLYTMIVKFRLTDNLLGLILPNMMTAVSIIMFRQFFLSLPDSLIEAARIDGCSELKLIFKIVVPLSRPAVVTVAIITFLTSWNDVLWPLIVIRNRSLMTLPQLITIFVLGGEAESHLGAELAASTMLAVPILLLYSFFQRYFIQSFVSSGVKG
ncbi:MAG TPA: carbohydrate ABC transporter permease [Candidatus Kryptonia bacterium]